MLYDTALTLGQDVDLFWRRRRALTGASAIFWTSRALALVNFVVAMCEYAPRTQLVSVVISL